MSIKQIMNDYYEYDRLLLINKQSLDNAGEQAQWAIDDGNYDDVCEHMQKFMKLRDEEKDIKAHKEVAETKLCIIIERIISNELTRREIIECIKKDNKLIRCLLCELEKYEPKE